MRDNYTFQKARVQWIREVDANSSYFYNCVNKVRRSNTIGGLMIDGVWVDDVEKVKGEEFRVFRDHFSRKQVGFIIHVTIWVDFPENFGVRE